MNKKEKMILLVGGDSGGHIFPLVAIGEELKKRQQPFIFVGAKNSREETVVQKLGWNFVPIATGKWRRYLTWTSFWENIRDLTKAIRGIFQAIKIIRRFKIELIFSKGGSVALPVVIAGWLTHKTIFVHESDAVMGLSNKIGSRFAHKVLTAFEPQVFPFADQRFVQVGIPIRQTMHAAATLKAPQKSRPLLLILPGSQGSTAINNYLRSTLSQLLAVADVIHLTGERDYPSFVAARDKLESKQQKYYRPYSFIERELPYYFQSADLLVARASATNIAESALFKKAMYLIPLPTAASNHQVANARHLEQANAAVVREQYQLNSEIFLADVLSLLQNTSELERLGEQLHRYFNEEQAITKIMNIINEVLVGQSPINSEEEHDR